MVDIHNFPKAPQDATLKRKRRSKKGGERTSNRLPLSPSKQPKKYETSIRTLRYAAVKAVEAAEIVKAVEVVKAVEAAEIVKAIKVVEAAEELGHVNKEAERESIEVSTYQNPYKSSNVDTYTNYDSINVNSSSILFPNTTIPNQPFGTNTKPTNEPEELVM